MRKHLRLKLIIKIFNKTQVLFLMIFNNLIRYLIDSIN